MPPATEPPTPSLGPLTTALRQIADRIPRLRSQGTRLSEQDTKRILITPTIEALGWDILDIDEVRNEYRHNSADNPVDYALFLNRSPVLFVEAKPLGHSLDDRRWIVQTINYANAAGVDWCVLTNGAEWRIYKVHAQVEADRKLFTTVKIEPSDALSDAGRVLRLLSRENMRARAIDELWQAWHVDGQVKAALELTLQDDGFATLIRKRVHQLSVSDIRKSLRRASVNVSYPNIFQDISAAPVAAPPSPQPVTPLPGAGDVPPAAVAGPPADDDSAPNMPRRRLQSTQALFELGRLKAGDTLTIRGRENSMARVIDGRQVDFRGQRMTFNDWGQRVTGWPSIRIYTMACLPDGRTLDQLRDSPVSVEGGT
jgi:predicted type IV restriction endonuclease